MTTRNPILLISASLLIQQLAWADASYQETTQITGGSLLSMMKMASVFSSRAKQAEGPNTSKVLIHENRMLRSNPLTTEIIDLDKKNITFIDAQKRQYSVVTFAEMQEAMNRAAQKMKESKSQKNSSADANVSFTAKVKETGAVKQIDGRDAKETVMNLSMDATSTDGSNAKGSMALTSDMWLVPDAPGYEEVRRFNTRMAQELSTDVDASSMMSMLGTQPGAAQAIADMRKETAKITGVPVLQNMRMGMTANGEPLPPPSADAPQANSNSSSQSSKPGLGSAFGSFMKRRAGQSSSSSDSSSTQGNSTASGPAILLETSTQRSNFSTDAVDAAAFEIPAGYKQVQSPMTRN